MDKNFMTLLMEGSVRAEAIDDYVERWHTGTVSDPLHTFLGMTWEEYGAWVQDPKALAAIVERREFDKMNTIRDMAQEPVEEPAPVKKESEQKSVRPYPSSEFMGFRDRLSSYKP